MSKFTSFAGVILLFTPSFSYGDQGWVLAKTGAGLRLPTPIHGFSDYPLEMICVDGQFGIQPELPHNLDYAQNVVVSIFIDAVLYRIDVSKLASRYMLRIPDDLVQKMTWGSLLTIDYPAVEGPSVLIFSLDNYSRLLKKLRANCQFFS